MFRDDQGGDGGGCEHFWRVGTFRSGRFVWTEPPMKSAPFRMCVKCHWVEPVEAQHGP